MKATTIQTIGALVGTAALAGSTVAGFAAPSASANGQHVPEGIAATQQAAHKTPAAQSEFAHVANAAGTFSFDQNAITPTHVITDVFCKAATALCVSLPDYQAEAFGGIMRIRGDVDNELSATVEDIVDSKGSKKTVLTCSCASNGAGGGAIANAEVEGVDLETIASIARAR